MRSLVEVCTMKQLAAFLTGTLLLLQSCLPDYDKMNSLDLDYNWYCTIWGVPVVYGSIVNKGTADVSSAELTIKITFQDNTTSTQRITVNVNVPSGERVEFREHFSNPRDENPKSVSASITDAW